MDEKKKQLGDITWYDASGNEVVFSDMTGIEMCEYIVDTFKKSEIAFPFTPEEFWNLSPSGELTHVFEYLARARRINGFTRRIEGMPGENMCSVCGKPTMIDGKLTEAVFVGADGSHQHASCKTQKTEGK